MNKNDLTITCTYASYIYPGHLSSTWSITTIDGRSAEVILQPEIPHHLSQHIVNQIMPKEALQTAVTESLDIRPKNINRFLSASAMEAIDALNANIMFNNFSVLYDGNTITVQWALKDLNTQNAGGIELSGNAGWEAQMDDFMNQGDNAETISSLKLTQRDIRKVFVVSKRIIKTFPKSIRKNTPLRGLYNDL